ncbi:unnamed protein product [Euphydryas editha]|uniref:Gag-like protein n=1 Tax=Euphydryas editha TaxID=104508 RepID=A0AAU9U9D2_EUPED|nr:unnamed protein product [Euphydryas editha]
MDFLEEALDICNTSSNMLEDITVQQVLDVVQPGCQKESEKRVLEKRGRENDSLEDEEGFVTVQKAAKRIARSNSISSNRENVEYRISITSKEILPKQFGMAKLLRSENINGISRIIYKNPYKVVIIFEKKECANKLIECEKLLNLGYRIYPADEMTLSYGIVKQVDMEEVDEEIIHNLKSDCEIIAVRRLKRLNDKGEWINSETIRLTFKSSTVPSFVYGFGCKFKVEKYIFPVSQCSNCWKFGHLSRSCTIKTPICPKCGDNHNNCETDNFKCVNCKRPHMALYKKCPIFLKEKEIRDIMSEKNCNYRNAMKLFAANKNKQNHIQEEVIEDQRINFQQSNTLNIQKDGRSYRDVVVEADVHQNMSTEED